jgi:hypothetical protein
MNVVVERMGKSKQTVERAGLYRLRWEVKRLELGWMGRSERRRRWQVQRQSEGPGLVAGLWMGGFAL